MPRDRPRRMVHIGGVRDPPRRYIYDLMVTLKEMSDMTERLTEYYEKITNEALIIFKEVRKFKYPPYTEPLISSLQRIYNITSNKSLSIFIPNIKYIRVVSGERKNIEIIHNYSAMVHVNIKNFENLIRNYRNLERIKGRSYLDLKWKEHFNLIRVSLKQLVKTIDELDYWLIQDTINCIDEHLEGEE